MKITLAKRRIVYKNKKYFVKIFKYDWQEYKNECQTAIYMDNLLFRRKLTEANCSYSIDLKDVDFVYFGVEAIKRFLKRKDYELRNMHNFESEFNGNYDETNLPCEGM